MLIPTDARTKFNASRCQLTVNFSTVLGIDDSVTVFWIEHSEIPKRSTGANADLILPRSIRATLTAHYNFGNNVCQPAAILEPSVKPSPTLFNVRTMK